MIKIEQTKDEATTIGGWFTPKKEVACSLEYKHTYTCDICKKSRDYFRIVSIGLYTGMMTFPFIQDEFVEIKVGHKQTAIHVCKDHSEKEIDKKIKKLLKS